MGVSSQLAVSQMSFREVENSRMPQKIFFSKMIFLCFSWNTYMFMISMWILIYWTIVGGVLLIKNVLLNMFGVETIIYRNDQSHAMATDDMAHCVSMSSATEMVAVQNLGFPWQITAGTCAESMSRNGRMWKCIFMYKNQHDKSCMQLLLPRHSHTKHLLYWPR